jgi:hypothetical protein
MPSTPWVAMILIDAHVHIHDCFHLDSLFNAAYDNFRRASNDRGGIYFLLLTESGMQNFFQTLRDQEHECVDWLVLPTDEPYSLILEKVENPGAVMFLVAGRQLVTAENLEVLALLTGEFFAERMPLAMTVDEVRRRGGLPALPWGAGKWLGKRKRVLSGYLAGQAGQLLFLADNRCRPWMWPFPGFARKTSLKILAGSDPLPFPREEGKAGSYGCRLAAQVSGIDPGRPARSLFRLLSDSSYQPVIYGHPETAGNFLKNQLAMQMHKRSTGTAKRADG